MPSPSLLTSQYPTMDPLATFPGSSLECDQQTLQLALQLSRFHFNMGGPESPVNGPFAYPSMNTLTTRFGEPSSPPSPTSLALKRSQNMTECVPVPSSEHVAEIVGKQGCKIKALRTKTSTYIKTPCRGEEPVFVITGRREDVEIAKAEIVQAADHFTQIRAQRRLHPPPHVPGQVTLQMPVPLRLVGLIVGPKGQTIKKVQQDTNTYIITPGRDKDPVFEITGNSEGVNRAKELIEDHVLARTGSTLLELLEQQNDPTRQRSASLDNSYMNYDVWRDSDRGFSGSPDTLSGDSSKNDASNFDISFWNGKPDPDCGSSDGGNSGFFSSPSKGQRSFSIAGMGSAPDYMDHAHSRRLNSDPMPTFTAGVWNSSSYNSNVFPDHSNDNFGFMTDRFGNGFGFGKGSLNSNGDSACSTSPAESVSSLKSKRECFLCQDSAVVAALVPCGHNLFCMSCANATVSQKCPLCHKHVDTCIRIHADI